MGARDIEPALKLYKEEVTRSEDKLLRLMDEGVLLRVGRQFEESNKRFFEAAKLIEMNGYTSLGEQAATLLTNERQTTYQGEDFEKVLVHLYLGLNFLELKQESEAQVEMRKVNEILQAMKSNGRAEYEFNAFAKYLGGVLFENSGDLNDALVSYRNTLSMDSNLQKNFPNLGEDILRLGIKLGFVEEIADWKKQFGEEAAKNAKNILENKLGSLVLVYESGKSPLKYSTKEYHRKTGRGGSLVEVLVPLSYYKERRTQIQRARIKIQSRQEETAVLNSIESTAVRQLKDRMGRQVAKALAVAATKVAVATAIGKAANSQDAGVLAGLALMLMSEADTRSWLLLPANLQIARVFLPAGTYSAQIEFLNASGGVARVQDVKDIRVKSSKASFVALRSFD